jgi:hypothetical protein
VSYLKVLSRYLPGATEENLSMDSLVAGRNSNLLLPEQVISATAKIICSVKRLEPHLNRKNNMGWYHCPEYKLSLKGTRSTIIKKVKVSRYTPWRRMGVAKVEEVEKRNYRNKRSTRMILS